MCGLLGLLTSDRTAAEVVDAVAVASHCMRHRGPPDEPGTWHDENIVFGFNRLSIIDIEHSHQPLRWGPPENPNRYALVFNGEIYNYLEIRAELTRDEGAIFRTEGDGEAIVAAFHHWVPTRCGASAACSRSPSGTPRTGRCSSPATRSASSRCSSRRPPAAWSSAARRSPSSN